MPKNTKNEKIRIEVIFQLLLYDNKLNAKIKKQRRSKTLYLRKGKILDKTTPPI
jgi:hypothetical protein